MGIRQPAALFMLVVVFPVLVGSMGCRDDDGPLGSLATAGVGLSSRPALVPEPPAAADLARGDRRPSRQETDATLDQAYRAALAKERGLSIGAFTKRYQRADVTVGRDPKKAEFFKDLRDGVPNSAWHHPLYRLDESDLGKLEENGFVLLAQEERSFMLAYLALYNAHLPMFVSADSVLHAWHRSFDDIVVEVETSWLQPTLADALAQMAEAIPEVATRSDYPGWTAAVADADVFLDVAAALLDDYEARRRQNRDAKPYAVRSERARRYVDAVLAEGRAKVELFGEARELDFSLFKPRGHYTQSRTLEAYFRSMMWLGHVDLPLEGSEAKPHLLVALALHELARAAGVEKELADVDLLLTELVGRSDSLSLPELGRHRDAVRLTSADKIDEGSLQLLVAALRGTRAAEQKIAGHARDDDPATATPARAPASFAFMGQRFALDSWVQSKLVWEAADAEPPRPLRKQMSGVDVAFSVFGNDAVVDVLESRLRGKNADREPLRDGSPVQPWLAATREAVDARPEASWDESVYTRWLETLRALSTPPPSGAPKTLKTRAWGKRLAQTQLASWTELRHDTLLYVKQFLGATTSCLYPKGTVEPNVAFWSTFRGMAERMAGVLQAVAPRAPGGPRWNAANLDAHADFFERFAATLGTLQGIAEKQERSAALSQAEIDFIQQTVEAQAGGMCGQPPTYSGWYPQLYWGIWDEESTRHEPVVADVFTDASGGVLQQGSGPVRMMVVMLDYGGAPALYVSPVYSWYEWVGSTRLTDDEWRAKLRSDPPAPPSFLVPLFGNAPKAGKPPAAD